MKKLHLHVLVIAQKLQENILKMMNVLNRAIIIIIMIHLNALMSAQGIININQFILKHVIRIVANSLPFFIIFLHHIGVKIFVDL
jgi:hypothetical protein